MVSLDNQVPYYQVARSGRIIIGKSRLGLRFKDIAHLDGGFVIASTATSSFDNTWTQPWGEKKYIRNHYNELRLTLVESHGLKRRMILRFRVYDDGIGFRYEIPRQAHMAAVQIIDELTEFNISDPATAWWIPARGWNRYEYLYRKTPLKDISLVQTPLTMKTDKGLYLSIHEAALVDYASMTLKRGRGRMLKADLIPLSDGIRVKTKVPFHTPWRTVQIADSAGGLITSYLILNLNEPNKLGDVSWVKPEKYIGIWWGMHLGELTWGSGPKHGATTKRTKAYIDFAAANGFKGVLVEGWNVGWDGDWFNNGAAFNFTKPYPDFDSVALAAYAKKKGVHLIGHNETAGNISNYEKQLGAALDYDHKLGIPLIK
ncbi:MAG: glycoside hydrolase family 97 protein, partial [Alphaproteobacteria bacterium]|nr:glycoside hydrolase family 97 protein [Alphaproteobacteria bacterium]